MSSRKPPSWTAQKILTLGRSYQAAAVLVAAADLDLFECLGRGRRTAAELSKQLLCNRRGLSVLLDALVALKLVEKSANLYCLPPGLRTLLTAAGKYSVLAMAQHQANCLRRWAQLARVVKRGRPTQAGPSVRGEAGDLEAFIGAMHNVSAPNAARVIQALRGLQFRHVLDLGGASGTWTLAFLRARRSCRATLFDLPQVVPLAERRLASTNLKGRIKLMAGDFMKDSLPSGCDFAWVSAIVHQNSRAQNRALFKEIFQALQPGGHIAIRDILMDETHTQPVAGALFAVNMLVATEGGGTFTLAELREDLGSAGFTDVTVLRKDEGMNSLVVAKKPGRDPA